MAAKTAGDVLDELTARGLAGENEAAAKSYISQAADEIRGYCGLPEGSSLPAGLFYAWVEVSSRLIASGGSGAAAGVVAGAVSSITEGDTTIQFGGSSQGAGMGGAGWALDGCRAVLNRYRRMAW